MSPAIEQVSWGWFMNQWIYQYWIRDDLSKSIEDLDITAA